MFAALGVEIKLVDARPEITLPRQRDRAAPQSGHAPRRQARPGPALERRCARERRRRTTLADAAWHSQKLLFAAGRVGCTADLGLENVGLSADSRGYLQVDEHFRTQKQHILAAGDVIGFPALASVSMEQGRVAICHAFSFGYKQSVAASMPYGIYTIPGGSQVLRRERRGLQEKESSTTSRAAPFPPTTRAARSPAIFRGHHQAHPSSEAPESCFGVHVIGERASELVHIGQVAIALGGTVDVFIQLDLKLHRPSPTSTSTPPYDYLGALSRPAY